MEEIAVKNSEMSATTLVLNEENVRLLWSKTYNTEGKPDWSHLFPYYHPNIVFEDTIQRIEGFADFSAMCTRLAERCKSLKMEILSLVKERNVILMDWKMTMSFKKFPGTPIFGSTKLILHADGRIIEQRDYYDLWGDIFNGIPRFGKMYRRFLHRYFG